MSKVTGWTKNTRFISIERAGNSLSELCKVANGSLQLNIRQHIMYVWNVAVSNFRPRLLAAWKLLMRLEKVSHTGASPPFIYNDATQSLFQLEATLSIFFVVVAHLRVYFYLICWSKGMPDWHPWGLLLPVGTCANEGSKQKFCVFWISWWF